jgi:hypothetical protein
MAIDYQQALLDAQANSVNPWLQYLQQITPQTAIGTSSNPNPIYLPNGQPNPNYQPIPGYTFQADPTASLINPYTNQPISGLGHFVDANGKVYSDASGNPYLMNSAGQDMGWWNSNAQTDVNAMNQDASFWSNPSNWAILSMAGASLGSLAGAGAGAGATTDASSFTGSPFAAVDASSTLAPPVAGIPDYLTAAGATPATVAATAGGAAGMGNALGAGAGVLGGAAAPDVLSSLGLGTGSMGVGQGLSDLPAGTSIGPNGLPDAGNLLSNVTPGTSGTSSWLNSLGSLFSNPSVIGGVLGGLDSLLQPSHTTQSQGGTSTSSNTSSLQLPSQLTGAANTALGQAGNIFGQGYQVAPLPGIFGTEQNLLQNVPQNTAPLYSSFANGANINPYLDMTFNAAADATQNRLGSEFANAGQYGSPQNIGARSNELQQLAAGIYGPGYNAAQQLQYGAQEAGLNRGLSQANTNISNTLGTIPLGLQYGQYLQQNQQNQLNAPTTGLNQYLSQLGGLAPYFPGTQTQNQNTSQTGSVTQPLYNNPLLSIAGGATLGNYFGNLFGQQGTHP